MPQIAKCTEICGTKEGPGIGIVNVPRSMLLQLSLHRHHFRQLSWSFPPLSSQATACKAWQNDRFSSSSSFSATPPIISIILGYFGFHLQEASLTGRLTSFWRARNCAHWGHGALFCDLRLHGALFPSYPVIYWNANAWDGEGIQFHKSIKEQQKQWGIWSAGSDVVWLVVWCGCCTYSIHWSIWARKFVEIIQFDYLPLA